MAPSDSAPLRLEFSVSDNLAGSRLDTFLAQQLPQVSRSQIRRLIDAGHVQVDGRRPKVAYRLNRQQQVSVELAELPRDTPQPENIPLEILYEDEFLAAVNKPPAMVVHPAKGHWAGTLVSALAYHFNQLSSAGGPTRPGIVHRLDRDTSGVVLVAKTDQVHAALAQQFQQRTVEKEYLAIVCGLPDRDRQQIQQPIGAHPYQREKMAIRAGHSTSRQASTFIEVRQRFDRFALVAALPKTGRTHQIRLHLAHIGHPVLCDRLYGGRAQITRGQLLGTSGSQQDDQVLLGRQALHALCIKLAHPSSGRPLEIQAPLPSDMQATIEALQSH